MNLKNSEVRSKLNRVKRIEGQVRGIGRMIEDHAYCPLVMTQIKAAKAALSALEATVLEGHLRHCVKNAMTSRQTKNQNQVIDELMLLFKKG